MIRYIEGKVQSVEEDGITVLIDGIGYFVHVPDRFIETIKTGQEVKLHTYQHVREDVLALYGFDEQSDLVFFRQLIQVAGVGARLGLAILSEFPAEEVKKTIIHGDIAKLSSVVGVGKKTAERIILDLKESIAVLPGAKSSAAAASKQPIGAVEALLALGYTQAEAVHALKDVDSELAVEEQVKQALRSLSVNT